jgi:hypothetical protein
LVMTEPAMCTKDPLYYSVFLIMHEISYLESIK